jgi:hypothetical protein
MDINALNQSIAREPIDNLNPLGQAVLGSQNERYELIKAAREPIRGQYIVVLKPEATMTGESDSVRMRADEVRAMAEESRNKGAEILNIYEQFQLE